MLTVVTSFSPGGYEQYGQRFVETFRQFWPASVRLICAWEGVGPLGLDGFDLLGSVKFKSFLERHKYNPVIAGLKEGQQRWSPKSKLKGYSFRHDALKFSRKVFAIAQVAKYVQGGKLFWIDADVRTHSPVPERLLHAVLPDDVSLCYLKREGYHSELGFTGYNLDRDEARQFIGAYQWLYSSDEFLDLPYWDDCNVFDWLIEQTKPVVKCIHHTSQPQPFDNSILATCMTHKKGKRKEAA